MRDRDEITTATYEMCPNCTDGSCRKCGLASGEHAAPGVRVVLRRIRFVCCDCRGVGACGVCGAEAHSLAARGVRVETVEERTTKRWVPSVHLRRGEGARCGTGGADEDCLTTVKADVTCTRCLKFSEKK